MLSTKAKAERLRPGADILSYLDAGSGVSICLWQSSQSPLIVDPSLAVCDSSWHRKQPLEVVWPMLLG